MNASDYSASPGLSLDASVWFFAGQIDDTEPVRHVPVTTTPFKIGRRPDSSLSLPCGSVSKEHAIISDRDGGLWIRDLNSTNGTYVNGEKLIEDVQLQEGDIVQFATVVFRVGRQQKDSIESGTLQADMRDRTLAVVQFERLINRKSVVPFYQPIVQLGEHENPLVGYEVLGRSHVFGLRTPKEMFDTASHFGLESELSQIFRTRGIEVATQLPEHLNLFVNTHPKELMETGLIESVQELRVKNPARPITLEIHEAAVTDIKTLIRLRDSLVDLDIQLAFDDFGAGQARLLELSEVRPNYLKFDMQLVQGIYQAPASRQHLVELLVKIVNELEIIPLAEGIEYQEDHETLLQMGFQLGQGYLYGRPAAISKYADDQERFC